MSRHSPKFLESQHRPHDPKAPLFVRVHCSYLNGSHPARGRQGLHMLGLVRGFTVLTSSGSERAGCEQGFPLRGCMRPVPAPSPASTHRRALGDPGSRQLQSLAVSVANVALVSG